MQPSVEQIVEDFKRASEASRRESDANPEKIREFFASLATTSRFEPAPRRPLPKPLSDSPPTK